MLVYKYNTRPPFHCTVRLSTSELNDPNLLIHISKVASTFNGHLHEEIASEFTYQFSKEEDMFSFGRFVFEKDFDPDTYQPYWIVKSPNLPDRCFSDKSSAFEELEYRIEQHPCTSIQAPSCYNPVIA
jgi:hypothetical protein